MVDACGTPGDGEGSGVTGVIVSVPIPVVLSIVPTDRLLESFGTRVVFDELAVTFSADKLLVRSTSPTVKLWLMLADPGKICSSHVFVLLIVGGLLVEATGVT